jgi:hypothetical protein
MQTLNQTILLKKCFGNLNNRHMKMEKFKIFLLVGLVAIAATGCLEDKDFEDGKIQSVDNHGQGQGMISTAVTAQSSDQFLAEAVDASATSTTIKLIPVVITSADPATRDIHVTMVPALDTLDSYNTTNGTNYVMPGGPGTPAFTLIDNGVVTIKAGQTVGYLQIQTATADYFGSTQYAFAYRISSVQEGNPISGNNNFGIVAVIPKNAYDGNYGYGPGKVERYTGGVLNTGDPLMGPFNALPDAPLVTTGLHTLAFVPLWADGGGIGGIGPSVTLTVDAVAQTDGTFNVTVTDPAAAGPMKNIPGEVNNYNPATKTFTLAFTWGTANVRKIWTKLVYKGPRS